MYVTNLNALQLFKGFKGLMLYMTIISTYSDGIIFFFSTCYRIFKLCCILHEQFCTKTHGSSEFQKAVNFTNHCDFRDAHFVSLTRQIKYFYVAH
jgi:hypothetical protein